MAWGAAGHPGRSAVTATFAGEDDFILVLDEVHAARVRVDQEGAVAASSETAGAGLRDDDVGNAFRVGSGRLQDRWSTAAAPPSAPAAASTARGGAGAGQQLRGRNRRAKPAEAAGAVRIDHAQSPSRRAVDGDGA